MSRIFIRSKERWTQKEDKGEGSNTRVKKVEKNTHHVQVRLGLVFSLVNTHHF